MHLGRRDIGVFILIFFLTIVTVFDLFTNVGRSANMDGLIHATTAEMFYQAIKQGEFPVTWVDSFGNYGLPLGIITQQLTTYLTAFIIFLVHNPVTAYNVVCFIGLLFSNIFFYIFLRLYLPEIYAFLGTFLFNFAPYRIINLYIRGAIPEAFSAVFLPLILLSLYYFVKQKKLVALFCFAILIATLAITHPMVLVIYSFLFMPYFIFLLLEEKGTFSFKRLGEGQSIKMLVGFFAAIVLGLGLASYYLLPLTVEIKYFYYGLDHNHLTPNQYMGLKNYFDPNWYYFTKSETLTRGHFIQSGLIETLGVIASILWIIAKVIKRKKKYTVTLFDFAVFASVLVIFFTTPLADFFYRHIDILSNIQFPWRMFTAFMFLPPILYAYLFKRVNSVFLVLVFIVLICVTRIPQLYGKNYTDYPLQSYQFTEYNLHSTLMNTIWSKRTEDYPIKKQKPEIANGMGTVVSQKVKNSSRNYTINAQTDVTMLDNTFYFPGWHAYVDGREVPIQFQNTLYQGMITYPVPKGEHTVLLRFEDTKIRRLAKLASLGFIILFGILFFMRKIFQSLIFGKHLASTIPTRVK